MKAQDHRDNIVRAVLGTHPTMIAIVANPEALDLYANVMAENEQAKDAMCRLSLGDPSEGIDVMVKRLLKDRG